MGDCFFGCDRCQEACPFNSTVNSSKIALPRTERFLDMTDEDFQKDFGKTSLARAGLEKIRTNIIAAWGGDSNNPKLSDDP